MLQFAGKYPPPVNLAPAGTSNSNSWAARPQTQLTELSPQVSIASSTKKFTPIYYVTVNTTSLTGDSVPFKLEARFSRWFDQDGAFVAKPFQQWLASEVPTIGKADPKSKQLGIQGADGGVKIEGNVQVAEAVVIPETTPATGGTPGGKARKNKKG